jgi:serine/threonine-protein kinase RsbW
MSERSGAADQPPPAPEHSPGRALSLRWRRDFPGDTAQLGVLRRWLESLLPPCAARDDVVSVANELGANAVIHTSSGQGGRFVVEVTWQTPLVRVAVADGGAASGPRITSDPLSEGGHGLRMVHELSVRTGVSGDQRGRVIWAAILWRREDAPEPPQFPAGYESAIRDEAVGLARRFPNVLTWFGPRTLQWWALPRQRDAQGLLGASSAGELAQLLAAMEAARRSPPILGDGQWHRRASSWHQRRKVAARPPVQQLAGRAIQAGLSAGGGTAHVIT